MRWISPQCPVFRSSACVALDACRQTIARAKVTCRNASSMVSSPLESWSVHQVAKWLTDELELPQKLADEFVANAISGTGDCWCDCWCDAWDVGTSAQRFRFLGPGQRLKPPGQLQASMWLPGTHSVSRSGSF